MAAIQQLGYHPDLTSRSRALHQVVPRAVAKPDGISNEKSQITEEVPKPIGRQIGLVLSAASPTETLARVPVLENVLRVEGFRLNIAVIAADPTSARERITRLRGEGSVGIIACPSSDTRAHRNTRTGHGRRATSGLGTCHS
jgi:DNA-binding LacI/PurR family transcriptional regulator